MASSFTTRGVSRAKSARWSAWFSVIASVAWLGTGPLILAAAKPGWPGHTVLDSESRSPDGHYGILIATSDHVHDGTTVLIEEEGEKFINYFVDLRKHRLLGKIKHLEYVDGENHAHFDVAWSADSKVCLATEWGRYGFATSVVLEPGEDGFTQTEIGPHLQGALDAAAAPRANDRLEVYPKYSIAAGPIIHVCATGSNNPKSLEGVETYHALFVGNFDLRSKKWTDASARAIDATEDALFDGDNLFDPGTYAISPPAFADKPNAAEPLLVDDQLLFRSPETEFKYLDGLLNDLYQAVRTLVSPTDFTQIKREQIAWLKTRDAGASTADKALRTAERLKVLQKLLP